MELMETLKQEVINVHQEIKPDTEQKWTYVHET